MYRRVLEGREKVLGHDHPDTLSVAKSLSRILKDQRKSKGALGYAPENPKAILMILHVAWMEIIPESIISACTILAPFDGMLRTSHLLHASNQD